MLIHQIGDDASGSFVQIGINVFGAFAEFDVFGEKHLFLVRGEKKTCNTTFDIAELAAFRTIGVHDPKLHAAAFVAHKSNALTVGHPGRSVFVGLGVGYLLTPRTI